MVLNVLKQFKVSNIDDFYTLTFNVLDILQFSIITPSSTDLTYRKSGSLMSIYVVCE